MGYCKDCLYFDRSYEVKKVFAPNVYGGTLLNQYVTENGSCTSFTPKPKYTSSTYNGGSGCFLTSACVKHMGKSDDCEELTLLRKYRDEYLKKIDGGAKLVEMYYEIAPEIVKRIDASENSDKYYDYIYGVVCRCVKLIKESKNEETKQEYVAMVEKLQKELL